VNISLLDRHEAYWTDKRDGQRLQARTVEELVEVAAGEEVVDEELDGGRGAEASELDEVSVLHGSESVELVLEAACGLEARLEFLDGQGRVVLHFELVDDAVAALADDVLLANQSHGAQHLLRGRSRCTTPLKHDDLPAWKIMSKMTSWFIF
jgi:hypothetical protein